MTTSGIHTRTPGSARSSAAPTSTGPAKSRVSANTAVQSHAQAEHTAKPAPTKPASVHRVDIKA